MSTLAEQTALAAEILGGLAIEKHRRIATAESCTGGLVSAAITEVAGSSQWFDRGFVVYTEKSKTELLEVDEAMIEREGVVSEAVAHAMARGAVAKSFADLSVSLTGVAGPTGGSERTPVGTVCIGWGEKLLDGTVITSARTILVAGNRSIVRMAAARTALQGLIAILNSENPVSIPCEFAQ